MRFSMQDLEKIILEVESLPIEMKTELIEVLLSNLHSHDKKIDDLWIEESEKRYEALKSGKVKAIPYEVVHKEIMNLLKK